MTLKRQRPVKTIYENEVEVWKVSNLMTDASIEIDATYGDISTNFRRIGAGKWRKLVGATSSVNWYGNFNVESNTRSLEKGIMSYRQST